MRTNLIKKYEDYIACLNVRDLDRLDTIVAGKVVYNGSAIGLPGYRAMLGENYRDIPDLQFNVDLLVADDSTVASRLRFECRPTGDFQGLPINGRRVVFYEHVFYRFMEGLIVEVWSVIDYKAIENQIQKTQNE